MLITTNKLFCYWLQGYFEIGSNITIDRSIVELINKQLDLIEEPLGEFTAWLQKVCTFIRKLHYRDEVCAHFAPIIELSLNSVFFHVIDNSYDTDLSRETILRIHGGELGHD